LLHSSYDGDDENFLRDHNPNVVHAIDELSTLIPSGPPGYQYSEPNYRQPIGGNKPEQKKDKHETLSRPQVNGAPA
jgi:hypothetical protein